MPDSKTISELLIAEQTSQDDLFETAIPNAMTETGYVSRKNPLSVIADFIVSVLQYTTRLNTTNKTITGAINELAQGSGQSLDTLNDVDIDDQTLADGQILVYDAVAEKWKNGGIELDDELEAGETTLIFTNPAITSTSTIDWYIDEEFYGIVAPKTFVTDEMNHTLTLTFDVQNENIPIKVVIK